MAGPAEREAPRRGGRLGGPAAARGLGLGGRPDPSPVSLPGGDRPGVKRVCTGRPGRGVNGTLTPRSQPFHGISADLAEPEIDTRSKGRRTPMNAQTLPALRPAPFPPRPARAGRADIHFHLLPGVDDGPRDMAETLA